MPKKSEIKCTFTSVWDDGSEITTPCTYNPETGEVNPESSNADPDGCLEREYIILPDEEELEVCTSCHEYVLKTVMNPGIGHDLNEEQECPQCKE